MIYINLCKFYLQEIILKEIHGIFSVNVAMISQLRTNGLQSYEVALTFFADETERTVS